MKRLTVKLDQASSVPKGLQQSDLNLLRCNMNEV
jgi:hypothetical protein